MSSSQHKMTNVATYHNAAPNEHLVVQPHGTAHAVGDEGVVAIVVPNGCVIAEGVRVRAFQGSIVFEQNGTSLFDTHRPRPVGADNQPLVQFTYPRVAPKPATINAHALSGMYEGLDYSLDGDF